MKSGFVLKRATALLLALVLTLPLCLSAFGAEVEGSYTDVLPNSETLQLSSPSLSANPGTTLTVPVSVESGALSSFEMTLCYPTDAVTVTSVALGEGLNGTLTQNVEYGRVALAYTSTEVLTKGTVLFYLTVKVSEKATVGQVVSFYAENPFFVLAGQTGYIPSYRLSLGELRIGLFGDVNLDGTVGVDDLIRLLRYRVGLYALDDAAMFVSDIDGDGNVSLLDCQYLTEYLAGMRTTLDGITRKETCEIYFRDYYGDVFYTMTYVMDGSIPTFPEAPVVSGMQFTSWSISPARIPHVATAGGALYVDAVYRDPSSTERYTVNFYDHNKDLITSRTVALGAVPKFPRAPEYEGMTFIGWSMTEDEVYNRSMAGEVVIEVYALYESASVAEPYTVYFYDYYKNLITSYSFYPGQQPCFPGAPQFDGMIFTGWSMTAEQIMEEGPYNGVVDVYANYTEYTEDSYVVNFYMDVCGEIIHIATVAPKVGEWISYPVINEIYHGYYFSHWSMTAEEIFKIAMEGSSFDVYAYYEKKDVEDTYRVYFYDQYGNQYNSLVFTDINELWYPEPPYLSGHEFSNWSMSYDDVINQAMEGMREFHIYAYYNVKTMCSITFHTPDGRSHYMNVAAGDPIPYPDFAVPEGMAFIGWSMTAEEIAAAIAEGATSLEVTALLEFDVPEGVAVNYYTYSFATPYEDAKWDICVYDGTAYVAAVESNNERHRYRYFTADCEQYAGGLLMTIVNENGGRYVMDLEYSEELSRLVARSISFDATTAPEHLTATQYTVPVDPELLGTPKEGFESYIYLTIYSDASGNREGIAMAVGMLGPDGRPFLADEWEFPYFSACDSAGGEYALSFVGENVIFAFDGAMLRFVKDDADGYTVEYTELDSSESEMVMNEDTLEYTYRDIYTMTLPYLFDENGNLVLGNAYLYFLDGTLHAAPANGEKDPDIEYLNRESLADCIGNRYDVQIVDENMPIGTTVYAFFSQDGYVELGSVMTSNGIATRLDTSRGSLYIFERPQYSGIYAYDPATDRIAALHTGIETNGASCIPVGDSFNLDAMYLRVVYDGEVVLQVPLSECEVSGLPATDSVGAGWAPLTVWYAPLPGEIMVEFFYEIYGEEVVKGCEILFYGYNGEIVRSCYVYNWKDITFPEEWEMQVDGATFLGWSHTLDDVRRMMEEGRSRIHVKPQYSGMGGGESGEEMYTVVFYNFYGNVIYDCTHAVGDYSYEWPMLDSDGKYSFRGWDVSYDELRCRVEAGETYIEIHPIIEIAETYYVAFHSVTYIGNGNTAVGMTPFAVGTAPVFPDYELPEGMILEGFSLTAEEIMALVEEGQRHIDVFPIVAFDIPSETVETYSCTYRDDNSYCHTVFRYADGKVYITEEHAYGSDTTYFSYGIADAELYGDYLTVYSDSGMGYIDTKAVYAIGENHALTLESLTYLGYPTGDATVTTEIYFIDDIYDTTGDAGDVYLHLVLYRDEMGALIAASVAASDVEMFTGKYYPELYSLVPYMTPGTNMDMYLSFSEEGAIVMVCEEMLIAFVPAADGYSAELAWAYNEDEPAFAVDEESETYSITGNTTLNAPYHMLDGCLYAYDYPLCLIEGEVCLIANAAGGIPEGAELITAEALAEMMGGNYSFRIVGVALTGETVATVSFLPYYMCISIDETESGRMALLGDGAYYLLTYGAQMYAFDRATGNVERLNVNVHGATSVALGGKFNLDEIYLVFYSWETGARIFETSLGGCSVSGLPGTEAPFSGWVTITVEDLLSIPISVEIHCTVNDLYFGGGDDYVIIGGGDGYEIVGGEGKYTYSYDYVGG